MFVSNSTSARLTDRRIVSGRTSPHLLQNTAVNAAAAGGGGGGGGTGGGLGSVDPLTHRLITQLHRAIDKHLETRASPSRAAQTTSLRSAVDLLHNLNEKRKGSLV